ncbi:MAG: hypothetical protein M9894_25580 [Planctomycetes bacterium]|nr:hypothetical protein [Planctomycetota bacterium]
MARGAPRKRKLSPLQRDLLWALEEAGGEGLATLTNALPGREAPAFLDHLQEAIAGLERAGLVELQRTLPAGRSGGPPATERLEGGRDVRVLLRREAALWVATEAGAAVELVLKPEGRRALST